MSAKVNFKNQRFRRFIAIRPTKKRSGGRVSLVVLV